MALYCSPALSRKDTTLSSSPAHSLKDTTLSSSPAHSRKDLAIHGMDCPFPVSVSPLGSNNSLHAGLSCSPPNNRRDLALRGIDCPFPISLSPSGSKASLHAIPTASNAAAHAPLTASVSLPTASSTNHFAADRAALSFGSSPAASTAVSSYGISTPIATGATDSMLLSGGEEVDAAAEAAALAPISIVRQRRRARNRQSRKERFKTQPVTIVELQEADEDQFQQQQQMQQSGTSADTNKAGSRRGSGLTRSLDNLQSQDESPQLTADKQATASKVSSPEKETPILTAGQQKDRQNSADSEKTDTHSLPREKFVL